MNPSEPQFRLAEIEVTKATVDEKIIGLFRFESEQKGKKGSILIIAAEIASTLYVYEQLLDALNERAEQVRHLVAGFDADPMARFEKTIQSLNEAVVRFLEQEPTAVVWSRVNLFVLQLSDSHLCFSGIGRMMNIFLQKQKDETFRSFDLFSSLEQPAEVNPQKPFISLVCGDVNPGDVLFVGTQNFERLRHELEIAERLKTLPPVTAGMEIRQDLDQRNIPDDFVAIIISHLTLPQKPTSSLKPAIVELEREKSTTSIERMYDEETKTQSILAPTIAPISANGEGKPSFDLKEKARQAMNAVRSLLPDRRNVMHPKDPIAISSLRGMSAGHGAFMNTKRKWTLAGGIALVILLCGLFLWYRHAKQVAGEQTLWNTAYADAADRKTKAEADVIIGNEERAQRLIKEASSILANLNEPTTDRKKAKADLQKELDDLQARLRREVRVDHPTELLTLALGSPVDSLQTIALLKDKIYTVDHGTGAVLQIDPLTRESKRLTLPTDAGGMMDQTTTKDNLLLLGESRAIYSVDPARQTIEAQTFGGAKASTTRAITFYNKRVYALDPTNNMIWKYTWTGSGLTQETAYLKQTSASLANAIDLTIDSNVYVLFADGKLVRYLSGVEETWLPSPIDPPLQSGASVWTSPDTDRILVADPVGKRVIVFRKDGKLVAQITSGDFTGPRFVTGDDKNKKIYVVDGNRVLTLDLP